MFTVQGLLQDLMFDDVTFCGFFLYVLHVDDIRLHHIGLNIVIHQNNINVAALFLVDLCLN